MDKLIKQYRFQYHLQVIFFMIVTISFMIPSYLFMHTKVKGYFEAESLTHVEAELHTIAKKDFEKNTVQALFQDRSMLNRTFLIDNKMFINQLANTKTQGYYIARLDDEFFIMVKRGSEKATIQKGRLKPVQETIRKKGYDYVKKEQYLSGNRRMETVVSPYVLEVGYAGNMTTFEMYGIFVGIIILGCFLIWQGYRLLNHNLLRISITHYEENSERWKEDMNYEVMHVKQIQDVLLGRHCLYLRTGFHKRIVLSIRYERIVWYYKLKQANHRVKFVVMDVNQRRYQVNMDEGRCLQIMKQLATRSPYAIQGYDEALYKRSKHHFYELLKRVEKNRQDMLVKKQNQMKEKE